MSDASNTPPTRRRLRPLALTAAGVLTLAALVAVAVPGCSRPAPTPPPDDQTVPPEELDRQVH
ncbi:MAG TPA: hypothetical protein VMS17_18430, partial [Gemmataceae bacterium]|nr:hypothetical protein [Gemmataceae bacterium]